MHTTQTDWATFRNIICRAQVHDPAVSDRWVQGVSDGLTDPLWALGAAVSASGQRSHAQAALDAAAAVALRASGQDHAAPASGADQSARRVRDAGGGRARPGRLRLADQYRLH